VFLRGSFGPRDAVPLGVFLAVILPGATLRAVPPPVEHSATAFRMGQLHYSGGGDWYGDQTSLPNLAQQLHERAGMEVDTDVAHPTPLDDELFACPMIFMAGHGNVRLSDDDVERLRWYFAHGGFLWADDDYGMDTSFRREMRKVFPDDELVELPYDHDLYHGVYDFPHGPPKIHEHDGGPARGFAIFHDGRMVVFYTFDTDIGDGLENAEVHGDPPDKREQAMRMAIDIVAYALTH
jgi:Domain of unknown function (DUF4159)